MHPCVLCFAFCVFGWHGRSAHLLRLRLRPTLLNTSKQIIFFIIIMMMIITTTTRVAEILGSPITTSIYASRRLQSTIQRAASRICA